MPEDLELSMELDEGELDVFDCSRAIDESVIELAEARALPGLKVIPANRRGGGLSTSSPFSSFNLVIEVWTDLPAMEQIPDPAELLEEMADARKWVTSMRRRVQS